MIYNEKRKLKMNEIQFYMCKEIAENDLITYLNNYFNKKIASLNKLESDGELFLQYNDYTGDVKVGVTLSWPLDYKFEINEKNLGKDMAQKFKTKILYVLEEENDEFDFGCIASNGMETKVNIINDTEDAIFIDKTSFHKGH